MNDLQTTRMHERSKIFIPQEDKHIWKGVEEDNDGHSRGIEREKGRESR